MEASISKQLEIELQKEKFRDQIKEINKTTSSPLQPKKKE